MATYVDDITFLSGNDKRYDTNDILVWKSDSSDFHTGSVVTVGESQEALFYLNGECMGTLGPGRHVLETDTIPWLSRLINWITRSKYIFHAEVYYVNKVETPIKWGVGDITYEDPLGPVFSIGAHGEVNVSVTNPRMLVEKLSGVEKFMTKEKLVDRFRGIITSEVTHSLVNMMVENDISVINVVSHLKTLSISLQNVVSDIFEEYGFTAKQFRILGVQVPETDEQYLRLKKLKANQSMMGSELVLEQQAELMRYKTDAEKTKIKAEAEAEKVKRLAEAQAYERKVGGYNYQEERKFDILKAAVENDRTGTGSVIGEMAQLGAGMGVMENFGQIMRKNMNSMSMNETMPQSNTRYCTECGAALGTNAKFCGNCGAPVKNNSDKCPNCGYQVSEGKFCPNCGQRLVKVE